MNTHTHARGPVQGTSKLRDQPFETTMANFCVYPPRARRRCKILQSERAGSTRERHGGREERQSELVRKIDKVGERDQA